MLSRVQLFAAPWTVACQSLLSMEFSRQEYWSWLPYPPPGDLSHPGIELVSLVSSALAGRFFITSATWGALSQIYFLVYWNYCFTSLLNKCVGWASLVAHRIKNLPAMQETQVWSLGREDPWENEMATHSSILHEEFHGQRGLVGYNPWGHKESDTTEQITHSFK